MMRKRKLNPARVRELLDYRPDTGEFFWRARSALGSHVVIGDEAGYIPAGEVSPRENYRRIGIDGVLYRGGYVAWVWVNSDPDVGLLDHINGNPLDDRIDNLRPASWSQNAMNRKTSVANVIGFKGVRAKKSRFEVRLGRGGGVHIGTFSTAEEAARAYDSAAIARYGRFAKTNFPQEAER